MMKKLLLCVFMATYSNIFATVDFYNNYDILNQTVLKASQKIAPLHQEMWQDDVFIKKIIENIPNYSLWVNEEDQQRWIKLSQQFRHIEDKINALYIAINQHLMSQEDVIHQWYQEIPLLALMDEEHEIGKTQIPRNIKEQKQALSQWVLMQLLSQYQPLNDEEKQLFVEQIPLIQELLWGHFSKQNLSTKNEDIHYLILNSYLQSIERNSGYLDPMTMENFDINQNHRLGGIGATLQYDWLTPINDTFQPSIKIISLVPDSPAAKSLLIDDVITGLKTKDAFNNDVIMTLQSTQFDDFIKNIRGRVDCTKTKPEPCTVNLIINRQNESLLQPIHREEIQITNQSITSRIESYKNQNIGIITIPSFYQKVSSDFWNHYLSLTDEGIDGLMIDVRNNPGGLLHEVISMLGMIIDVPFYNVLLSTNDPYLPDDNPQANEVFLDTIVTPTSNLPIAVLINENSASAAEILAGTLKEYNRALILGTRSYGKGSVQTVIPLQKGLGGIKLTINSYHFPSGESPEGIGVTPHIELYQANNRLDVKPIKQGLTFGTLPVAWPLNPNIINSIKNSVFIPENKVRDDRVLLSKDSWENELDETTEPMIDESVYLDIMTSLIQHCPNCGNTIYHTSSQLSQ
ncbi:MAG: S41 family peptidase [Candidatus Comchoanobacterales bacterium]